MKFNYKKIATVIGSVLMVGSTVGMAAAANYPTPFVSNGAGDYAVVYGASAATLDIGATTKIAENLKSKVTVTSSTGSELVGGDSFLLQDGTDMFNLGSDMTDFQSPLDADQLSKVLAEGTYENDDHNEFDYKQQIELGANALSFFADDDNDDTPTIGFEMSSSALIMNYTLDFTDNADNVVAFSATDDTTKKLKDTEINILGRNYFISGVEGTSNGVQLTLLDSANTATVAQDETITLAIGSKTYSIVGTMIGETSVDLTIDGTKITGLEEGESKKLSDGSYVSVKHISSSTKESVTNSVEFTIGTGKITLENGQEVQVNDEAVSDMTDSNYKLYTYFTNTSTKLDKMILSWSLTEDYNLVTGNEMIMPAFGAVKLSMAGWNEPKQEVSTIKQSGRSARLSTTIEEGAVELYLLHTNSSKTGIDSLGQDSNNKFVSNSSTSTSTSDAGIELTLSESEKSTFVVTYISGKNAESYALEMNKIELESGDNKTTLNNLVSGGSDVVIDAVGQNEDIGTKIKVTLVSASDSTGNATIRLNAKSGTVYADRLVTKDGLQMLLPVNDLVATTASVNGHINMTAVANPTQWITNLTEEDKDGNIGVGDSFTIKLKFDGDNGIEAVENTGITLIESATDSDEYVGYKTSPLATKLEVGHVSGTIDTMDITYHGDQASANVYVSETSTTMVGGSTGVMTFKDSEVSSFSGKNLVVVGGSCINIVAAKMLNSDVPICGADFTALTQVGVGQFIVKVADNPYTAGKVAMLVAGYDDVDTAKAATYVTTGTVATTVGTNEVKTTSTIADLA